MKPARGAAAASTGPAAKQKEAVGKKVFHLLGGSGMLLMNSLSLFSHPIHSAAVIIEEVNFSLIITKMLQSPCAISGVSHFRSFIAIGLSIMPIFASILIYSVNCILYVSIFPFTIFMMIMP